MNEPPGKPSFADAYFASGLTFGMLDVVQELANIEQTILLEMLQSHPVVRAEAEKVLWVVHDILAGSRPVRSRDWTLDTLNIPVKEEER